MSAIATRKSSKTRNTKTTIGEGAALIQKAAMAKAAKRYSVEEPKTPAKTKEPKAPTQYAGAPIEATKLFRRDMEGFSKKQGNGCKAEVWMAFNKTTGKVTFANTYNDLLKPSYNADHYTYEYKPKVHDAKMDAMQEVEVDSWPTWVKNANGKSRKSK